MKISYISDLHCEFGVKDLVLPGGDVLLLAGDIVAVAHYLNPGNHFQRHHKVGANHCFQTLMENEFSKYEKVFMVMGNHEYYGGDTANTIDMLKAATSQYPFFKILDNDVVFLTPEWSLFGTTLWTDYKGADQKIMDIAQMGMNDHWSIRNNGRVFTPLAALNRNDEARAHIKQLGNSTNWIVMSHHSPSMRSSHAKWGGDANRINYAFHNTGLDDLIKQSKHIKYWIHGHTHDTCRYKLGKCQVLCNPKGYGGENASFDPTLQFEI